MGTHTCPVRSFREWEQRPKDQGRKQRPAPGQSAEGPWAERALLSFSDNAIYQSLFWVLGEKQIERFLPS